MSMLACFAVAFGTALDNLAVGASYGLQEPPQPSAETPISLGYQACPVQAPGSLVVGGGGYCIDSVSVRIARKKIRLVVSNMVFVP